MFDTDADIMAMMLYVLAVRVCLCRYNPAEHNVLITNDVEGGSYELLSFRLVVIDEHTSLDVIAYCADVVQTMSACYHCAHIYTFTPARWCICQVLINV
jgi:hypothetical protein